MTATNFEDFVQSIAEEAPHAVILDWYRRLELMVRDYIVSRGIRYRNATHAEAVVQADSLLGTPVADAVGRLRRVRNEVAHTSQIVTSLEAVNFARESLSLIGQLWSAER